MIIEKKKKQEKKTETGQERVFVLNFYYPSNATNTHIPDSLFIYICLYSIWFQQIPTYRKTRISVLQLTTIFYLFSDVRLEK